MNTRTQSSLISLEKVEHLLHLEPALLLLGLSLACWLVYKLFLRDISAERHKNLQGQFKNLVYHLVSCSVLFVLYFSATQWGDSSPLVGHLTSYLGLITLIQAAIVLSKTFRIFSFEYLFLGHKKVGVPVLLVNLSTLLLTLVLAAWLLSAIFNIRLAPLLATSAIFSLVLGLALQDTLGNLFAGIALQLDKPYEIGDWIEIQSSGQKWVGQVHEITWRATVLIGYSEEAITVPNRTMAQAQISNFATRQRPLLRRYVLHLPYGSPIERAKTAMIEAAKSVPGVIAELPPIVFLGEANEKGIEFKLFYSIQDYGTQFTIADRVATRVLENLEHLNLQPAAPRFELRDARPRTPNA